jgi:hypothetical protein
LRQRVFRPRWVGDGTESSARSPTHPGRHSADGDPALGEAATTNECLIIVTLGGGGVLSATYTILFGSSFFLRLSRVRDRVADKCSWMLLVFAEYPEIR